jgi:hypothetical protein
MLNNFIFIITKKIDCYQYITYIFSYLCKYRESFGTEVLIQDQSEIQFLLFCNLLCIAMLSRKV